MEEIQNTNTPTPLLPEDTINKLVGIKETTEILPKKVRVLPLIIIGLVISVIIIGIGTFVWKFVSNNHNPDLVIDAPINIAPTNTSTPSTVDGTAKLITKEVSFEPNPYTNELAGFEIRVPQNWSIDDSGQSGAIVVLIDPKVVQENNGSFMTFVSVTSGPSELTLEEEVNLSKSGLIKTFDSYKVEEDKQITLSGNTYHLLGGTYLKDGVKMKNRNLILIYNNRGYAVSATSPDSVWPNKELTLNATLFSFKNIK